MTTLPGPIVEISTGVIGKSKVSVLGTENPAIDCAIYIESAVGHPLSGSLVLVNTRRGFHGTCCIQPEGQQRCPDVWLLQQCPPAFGFCQRRNLLGFLFRRGGNQSGVRSCCRIRARQEVGV